MCVLSEAVEVRLRDGSVGSVAVERVSEFEGFSGSEFKLEWFLLGENGGPGAGALPP